MYDTILLFIKIFEIIRVYNTTAFYVRLIAETVKDMSVFLIFFFGSIFMSTTVLYVMQMNDLEAKGIDEIAPFIPYRRFINSFIN